MVVRSNRPNHTQNVDDRLRWTQSEADREFRSICSRLVPDWSEAEHWTLVLGHHPDYPEQRGLCVPLRQMLFVAPAPNLDKWRAVLIHEICHAITGTDHGSEFRECLTRVARRAEKLGESALAAVLLREPGCESPMP